MKLNTKLIVGFLTCVMISGIVGGIGIFAIKKSNNATTAILEEGVQTRDLDRLINISMLQARRSEKDYILRSDWKYVDKVKEQVADIKMNS